jgi:hypothetical protein
MNQWLHNYRAVQENGYNLLMTTLSTSNEWLLFTQENAALAAHVKDVVKPSINPDETLVFADIRLYRNVSKEVCSHRIAILCEYEHAPQIIVTPTNVIQQLEHFSLGDSILQELRHEAKVTNRKLVIYDTTAPPCTSCRQTEQLTFLAKRVIWKVAYENIHDQLDFLAYTVPSRLGKLQLLPIHDQNGVSEKVQLLSQAISICRKLHVMVNELIFALGGNVLLRVGELWGGTITDKKSDRLLRRICRRMNQYSDVISQVRTRYAATVRDPVANAINNSHFSRDGQLENDLHEIASAVKNVSTEFSKMLRGMNRRSTSAVPPRSTR